MKLLTNVKLISSFSVTKQGEIKALPIVRYVGILKSEETAKKIVADTLNVSKATVVVTNIEALEQWYEIDEELFFNNATPIEAPRKSKKDKEAE